MVFKNKGAAPSTITRAEKLQLSVFSPMICHRISGMQGSTPCHRCGLSMLGADNLRFIFCWRLLGLIPGGAPFSQLSSGVKDAMVVFTRLVKCHFMTKTCRKAG